MGLRLHNTLTKRVEELVTREAGKAAIYGCGPAVYGVTHLGRMRAAVVCDVLRRYLEFRGYQVMHVQNVTDVEDKIIARAQAEGVPTDAITARYLEDYRQASRALNVMPPHVEPRASQHIPEMIEMIKKLVEGGYAYSAEGDVYFDVSRLPQYGKLSGQLPGELRAGARVEPGEHKRHPADFALWKGAKPGEPSWDGPCGRGRPGCRTRPRPSTGCGSPWRRRRPSWRAPAAGARTARRRASCGRRRNLRVRRSPRPWTTTSTHLVGWRRSLSWRLR